MGVEASVIVVFEDGEISSDVIVELDGDHANNQDDEGVPKSSFLPSDKPVFLVSHPSDLEISHVLCTHPGSVPRIGTGIGRTRIQNLLFTGLKTEHSISYHSCSIRDKEFYGNECSIYLDDKDNTIKIQPSICSVGSPGCGDSEFPSLCDVELSVTFNAQYQLIPPSLDLAEDETYTIYVVIYMKSSTILQF